MGIVISALVTFWVGFLIYKKYKPQPVLFLGGMILMYIAVLCGYGTILPEKASTGSWFFDAFEFMRKTMSSNAAGLDVRRRICTLYGPHRRIPLTGTLNH